jgi:hypothetical protein
MKRGRRTYSTYSITSAVVWLVLLGLVWAVDSPATRTAFLLVGLGWWIGWLSATIARSVYPPPKKYEAAA